MRCGFLHFSRRTAIRTLAILPIVFVLALAITWIGNLVKLTKCDFQANYKCEVIHGIGLVPAISLVTFWFPADESGETKP